MSHRFRQPVAVQLMDRERFLLYDMAAWECIKAATGFNVLYVDEGQLQKLMMENLPVLLHAGLLNDDPTLTLEVVSRLYFPGDMARILQAVALAIRHSLLDPEKQPEVMEGAEPDPTPPAQLVV
ncbi:MAG: hypothetical protein L0312_12730 [Acidobacteria bacterium]|nr:hypothetical protein [Acidobacteriota bacterium]